MAPSLVTGAAPAVGAASPAPLLCSVRRKKKAIPPPLSVFLCVNDMWVQLGSRSRMSVKAVDELGKHPAASSVKLEFELILFLRFRFYVNLLKFISHAR
jgi:hypothetical protein